jgi:hypothetical protein
VIIVSEPSAEQGSDKTIQAIKNSYNDRASSISRYFEQLTSC